MIRRVLVGVVVGVGLLALLAANPSWFAAAWQALSTDSISVAAAELRAFGPWAVVVSLVLMVAQSVIAPLPGSLLAAANGVVFGVWWGTLLSYAGGMLGAAASFGLARWIGRSAVERRLTPQQLAQVNKLSDAHGFWVVLVARVTPIISLDLIGYLAGLSRMSFRRYMLANAIGVAPGMWAYTVLGHDLALARGSAERAALILLAGLVLFLVGRWWLARRGV